LDLRLILDRAGGVLEGPVTERLFSVDNHSGLGSTEKGLLCSLSLKAQVPAYDFVEGAPAQAGFLDLENLSPRFARIYQGKSEGRNLARFFFGDLHLERMRFPKRQDLTAAGPDDSDFVSYALLKRSRDFSGLRDFERRHLERIFKTGLSISS